jgi:hypothetical protein
MEEETKHVITTTQGVEVEIHLVPAFRLDRISEMVREEFKKRGEPIEPPTTELQVGRDGVQIVPMREAWIETPEEQKAWDAHIDAVARMEEEAEERRWRVFINRGIANQPPDDNEWAADAIADGLAVPDDPVERKLMWVEEALAPVVADRDRIATAIKSLSASGYVETGDVNARIDFFRRFNNLDWHEFRALVAQLAEAAEPEPLADAPGAIGAVDDENVGTDAPRVAEPAL